MRFKFLVNLSLLFFLLTSCKEFIEPSISKKNISLLAPADNYQTEKYTVNFWWETLEDALHYRLQIVRPSFDSAEELVMDTLVNHDKFSATLEPGIYQWRVRAENGSTETAYTAPKKFIVVQSSLALQKMQLLTPANNALVNQTSVSFKWISLYGATSYRIQVDTSGFANEANLVLDRTTPAQQWNFAFPKDHNYQWRVKALNDTEESPWSAVYTVSHDRTPPAAPKLTSPDNNAQMPLSFTFRWEAVSGARKYKLYLFKNGSTTPYKNFPVEQAGTSYDFTAETSGEQLVWRVTAFDGAGNESVASESRNVRVQ